MNQVINYYIIIHFGAFFGRFRFTTKRSSIAVSLVHTLTSMGHLVWNGKWTGGFFIQIVVTGFGSCSDRGRSNALTAESIFLIVYPQMHVINHTFPQINGHVGLVDFNEPILDLTKVLGTWSKSEINHVIWGDGTVPSNSLSLNQ